PADCVHVMDRGEVLDITARSASVAGRLNVSRVMVDGRDLESDLMSDIVLRDRQHLAEDGIMVVILGVDGATGEFAIGPEITSRGFVHVEKGEEVLDECRRVVSDAIGELGREAREEAEVLRNTIRRALRKHLAKAYDRHPLIVPTIVE